VYIEGGRRGREGGGGERWREGGRWRQTDLVVEHEHYPAREDNHARIDVALLLSMKIE